MSVSIGRVPPTHPMDNKSRPAAEISPPAASPLKRLTARELEVFEAYCRTDATTAARELRISPKTVKNHLTHVFRVLDVANARQAAYVLWGPPSRR